jgi:hypothetical protein
MRERQGRSILLYRCEASYTSSLRAVVYYSIAAPACLVYSSIACQLGMRERQGRSHTVTSSLAEGRCNRAATEALSYYAVAIL